MKNTREIALEYRLGHWGEIMRRRAESGLNITKFCEQEGMHPNRYHYWQRRLRTVAESGLMETKAEATAIVPTGWTQVSAAEESDPQISNEIMIEIGKCRVTVNNGANTELLGKICKVLVSIC